MSPDLEYFLFGAAGSVTAEVVLILNYYGAGKSFPGRFHKVGYWMARLILVLLAGVAGMSVAPYAFQARYVAFAAGVCTPAIVRRLVS